jgi:uncharacterized protein (DUF1778 family)
MDEQPITEGSGGDWALVATGGGVPRRSAAVVSVRLDPDAADLIRRASRLQQVTQAEFVRRAAVAAAHALLAEALEHLATATDQEAAHLEYTQLRAECARLREQNTEALLRFQDAFALHQGHQNVDWRYVAVQMAKALAG